MPLSPLPLPSSGLTAARLRLKLAERPGRNASFTSHGFSLMEALISASLLSLVVINSAQTFSRSQQTMKRSSSRDLAYSVITKDLEQLRQGSWTWACVSGTACTGLQADASTKMKYMTAADSTYIQYCKDNKVAERMKIALGINNATLNANGLGIQRTVAHPQLAPGAEDKNQLMITYSTASTEAIRINLKAIIVPQALSWCA